MNHPSKIKISIGISPDTDDWFMVRALREKLIDTQNFEFDIVSMDIQSLNEIAREKATFDISAVSMGSLPLLSANYALLPIGASIGDRFGPCIVCADEDKNQYFPFSFEKLRGRTVAVPGLNTSAYLAAKALFGDSFEAKPYAFDQIANAVLSKECDLGILIHELQIDTEGSGVTKLSDLGSLWWERYQAPLPLGGIVIRKSLGEAAILDLTKLYRESIQYALNSRQESLKVAISQAKTTLDLELADRYISMYVNNRSLDMSEEVINSLDIMFHGEGGELTGRAFRIRDHLAW